MFSEVVVSLAISVETFLSDAFKNVYHAVAGEISGIVLFFSCYAHICLQDLRYSS